MGGPSARVLALDITGYDPAVNDRFASGFPTAPVPNTSGSFVGQTYDWSGVGWSTMDGTKGFGFITPQHYLVARHYGGAATIRLVSPDGTLRTGTEASVTDTNYGVVFSGQTVGDLSIGRLTAPTPSAWQIVRYAVLDLNSSSTTNNSYNGQPLLVYGRGTNGSSSPRVGAATINGTTLSGSTSQVTSSYADVQLKTGDSGSPIFIPWTNVDGGLELTILGNNAGTDGSTTNGFNYFANSTVLGVVNSLTTPYGFALRVVGNSSATWVSGPGQGDFLYRAGNWSGSNIPTDQYVLFNGTITNVRALNVNAATSLRGLSFKSSGTTGDAFTFSGANTLTIGRGGITNYDADRQTFTAPIALGDHQYWDVGSGGVTAGAINTNGKLLEIAGSGTARITGAVSGTGGIALTGSRLELTGSSTYTGATWAHAGTLVVNGQAAASSGVTIDAGATLAGSGVVAAIGGAGTVAPGTSPGILTAPAVDGAGGLDFTFEFTGTGSPAYGTGTASGNDVLRLTGTAPFTQSLSAANAINVFLNVPSLAANTVFRGGFFTDRDSAFLGSVQNAAFSYYLFDSSGGTTSYGGTTYSLYTGTLTFQVATVAETAGFAGGTEAGYVTQFTVVPEPSAFLLTVSAAGGLAVVRAVRRRRG